jgi:hypothetical protein
MVGRLCEARVNAACCGVYLPGIYLADAVVSGCMRQGPRGRHVQRAEAGLLAMSALSSMTR